MTYVVTEACIRCKYMDCVEVCPVDCFYEGENMLVIHPTSASIAACASRVPCRSHHPRQRSGAEQWLQLNREYSSSWPNITRKNPIRKTQTNGRRRGNTRNSSPLILAVVNVASLMGRDARGLPRWHG